MSFKYYNKSAGKGTQWEKALFTKPDDLSVIPRTLTMEERNQLAMAALSPPR